MILFQQIYLKKKGWKKKMNFVGVQAQLVTADFFDLEKLIGAELPRCFKEHYIKYNGGFKPQETAEANPSPLHGFNSIKYGTLSIESLLNDYAEQDVQFGKKVPFAYDAGGELVCYVFRRG